MEPRVTGSAIQQDSREMSRVVGASLGSKF